MTDMELSVGTPGAQESTRQLTTLERTARQTGQTFDRTESKAKGLNFAFGDMFRTLRSGDVVRQVAGSMVLLGNGAEGADEKVASVAASLTAVPGPIGLISAAVAGGITLWQTWGEVAEEASEKAENAAEKAAEAAAEFKAQQDALAGRGADAAAIQSALSFGAGAAGIEQGIRAAGTVAGGAAVAGELARADIRGADRDVILEAVRAARSLGAGIDAATVSAIVREFQFQATGTQAFANNRQRFDPLAALVGAALPDVSTESISARLGRLNRAGASGVSGFQAAQDQQTEAALERFRAQINGAAGDLRALGEAAAEAQREQRRADMAERAAALGPGRNTLYTGNDPEWQKTYGGNQ